MAKEDCIKLKGQVIDAFPGAKFRVKTETGHELNCTIGGRLRINNIRISLNDFVDVEMSPYDLNNGRIVYRHK